MTTDSFKYLKLVRLGLACFVFDLTMPRSQRIGRVSIKFWLTHAQKSLKRLLIRNNRIGWALFYLFESLIFKKNNVFVILRCFDTVFQRPYRYFSITLKVFFSLSDRCKIFTSNWLFSPVIGYLTKIDISMTTINKKLWNW